MSVPLPKVQLVIPVLNEAKSLERSVRRVREFLGASFPYRWEVFVADNGSSDGTQEIAARLSEEFDDVGYFSIPQRGRGRALRKAWTESDADIVAYTDVDLSTELEALEKLCRAIHEDGYDLATGSRLMRESRIKRGLKRDFISRCYNLFIKCVLFTRFSDAQCGFKAVSRSVVREILPQVKDEAWFFDTELLVLGEKQGYRIKDVPVVWIDDEDSRVKIVSTAWEDIKGVFRVRRYLWSRAYRESRAERARYSAQAETK
jgi:glycosyltransferase involved in cell wall biosynthesis